jgi:4-hydroxybenzoate polyprenyltransferase
LLRAPNLLTVPGDPIVGFLLVAPHLALARWPALAGACAVSLLAYAMGLIVNDLADLRRDRRERPDRPLPAGEVSRSAATVVAVALGWGAFLAGTALGGATHILSALLVLAVLFYDLIAKRLGGVGPGAMAACRGLSVLVGAGTGLSVRQPPASLEGLPILAVVVVASIMAYIAALTSAAKREARAAGPGKLAYLPAGALLGGHLALTWTLGQSGAPAAAWIAQALAGGGLVALAIRVARRMVRTGTPGAAQSGIGAMVRLHVLQQAALAAVAILSADSSVPVGAVLLPLGLLALWPLSGLLGRWFYGS